MGCSSSANSSAPTSIPSLETAHQFRPLNSHQQQDQPDQPGLVGNCALVQKAAVDGKKALI